MNKNADDMELKQARRFALTAFIVTGALAAISFLRGKPTAPYIFGVLSAFMLIARFILPGLLLRPVHRAVMAAARAIGWVNAVVALGFAFFFVFTPAAIIIRIAGRDFMQRRFDPSASTSTYWQPREETPFDPKRYEQRF